MLTTHHLPIASLQDDNDVLFYDIETTDQFAPYCELKLIVAQYGLHGKPFIVATTAQKNAFRSRLANPRTLKFGWNNKNFDDIVLHRHGYPVCEQGSHDLMLIAKTIAPYLASYSLKFVSWHYFADAHQPEFELERYAKHNNLEKWSIEGPLMERYALHDIKQTAKLFQLFWDVVIRTKHWDAYCLDLSQGEPLRQMMLDGGLWLDETDLSQRIEALQLEKLHWEDEANRLSKGAVKNPNSSKQLGEYLDSEGFSLAVGDNGNFSVPKSVLIDLIDLENGEDLNPVARCAYEVRRANGALKYFQNYVAALTCNVANVDAARPKGWIPVQYSISGARTRRYLSNSKFKLNFQNPDKEAKKVQLVPKGWLGVWIDSTQVENVVHIYESSDRDRRLAYEADENWNEYVWLCNQILGGSRGQAELDATPSPHKPNWSIYKQFKTAKLALNFGMGIAKFCETCGLGSSAGRHIFAQVQEACPAIARLQERVANDLSANGEVTDAFGHIYTGKEAYKVVAYLIQGCGTGSLPKAQIRANYDTILPLGGVLAGTTHDECSLRLPLSLGPDKLLATLQDLMYNMTGKFSHKFDNIPLRAKLYLSRTTTYDAEKINITDEEKLRSFF